MPITTLDEAKTFLQIPEDDKSKDSIISALIEPVEADYLRIRNKPFDTDEEGNVIYPDGAGLVAALMISYHLNTGKRAGIASQSLGDHSVTFKDLVNGYPKEITGKIRRYVGSV